ncbi:MAG: pyrroline-5-carboxylate reductase [Clostridia bacterium]|nr:pyrroline-5-carboxylate reductase [Clostridia bacterium]
MKKIGCIGCGNMGGALASAIAKTNNFLYVTDTDTKKAEALAERLSASVLPVEALVEQCDMVLLGVKPQGLAALAKEIAPIVEKRGKAITLVSMCAGVKLEKLQALFGKDAKIIRIMPNTPAAVGEGMILYVPGAACEQADTDLFLEALAPAGKLSLIAEDKIDAASAVSGCGPAFAYMFAQGLAEGGVLCGLSHADALAFAAQTMLGAGKMLLEGMGHPEALKDAVCSPGGSTIEGVKVLEDAALRGALIEAVEAAYLRTKELGKS